MLSILTKLTRKQNRPKKKNNWEEENDNVTLTVRKLIFNEYYSYSKKRRCQFKKSILFDEKFAKKGKFLTITCLNYN